MCDAIKLLFTYLYMINDVFLNICTYIFFLLKIMCNVSSKLVACVVLSISLVFDFYRKTEMKLLGFSFSRKPIGFQCVEKQSFFKIEKLNQSFEKMDAQPYSQWGTRSGRHRSVSLPVDDGSTIQLSIVTTIRLDETKT
jgi:hypothetical protein